MISDKAFMISTAYPDIYTELVDTEKKFLRKHHLSSFGLVYGVLHKSYSNKKPDSDLVYLNRIQEEVTKNIIDIIHVLLDDGRTEEKIFDEILRIADGGILDLKEIYDKNKDFTIPNLIQDSEKL